MAAHDSPKTPPFRRFLRLIVEDRREVLAIIAYAFLNSLLLLAVPLAAQGLVNLTAAGLSLQPLVVLTAALFLGLLFAGLFACVRHILAEVILERIFCRVALRAAEKFPVARVSYLLRNGGPELVNRFFDVINVQKSWSKLVFDVPSSVLEIAFGLSLLALYGVELFLAATAFVAGGGLLVALAGIGGLKTSIAESAEKYRVAEWLEEMVRCQDSLRLNSDPDYWVKEADLRAVSYLKARRKHFRVLLTQIGLHYVISAISLSGMLGYGGYLVVVGQLSLGQLVAAELVLWSLLKATEKLLRACEAYFDLLTGLDKVAYITELPVDPSGHLELDPSRLSVGVVADSVSYTYQGDSEPVLKDICFKVSPGERVALVGPTGSGKSTLLRLMTGHLPAQSGYIELDGIDVQDLSIASRVVAVGYLSERNEIFSGSLHDNVALGRPADLHRIRGLLTETGGRRILRRKSNPGPVFLESAGSTLSAGEQKSILLSRALLGHPPLLILDDLLGELSGTRIDELVSNVFNAPDHPTIFFTSHRLGLIRSADRLMVMEEGRLVEQGAPRDLASDPGSRFATLYPFLAKALAQDGEEAPPRA